MISNPDFRKAIQVSALGLALFAQPLVADESGWDHSASIYLWGASIGGKTTTDQGIDVSFDDLLDNLEFGGMAAYNGRGEKWSVLADLIYLDVGKDHRLNFTPPIGGEIIQGGVDLGIGLKGWVIQGAAGYELYDDNEGTFTDFIFGARYLDLSTTVDVDFDLAPPNIEPSIRAKVSDDVIDAIIGLRGKVMIGSRWFLPWGVNVGAGDSDFTFQANAGIGFQAADWVDIVASYRYLKWEFDDDGLLSELDFSGPLLGAVFRF